MRRSKKYSRPVRPLNAYVAMDGVKHKIGRDDAEYKVFHTREAARRYVCPGCGSSIDVGEVHEVARTEDTALGSQFGIDSRRHWHTSCWRHRGTR